MEKKFIRVRSKKDVIISASLIIAGLVLALIPESVDVNLGGYALIAVGVSLACILKTNYKNVETQQMYIKKEFYFSGDKKTHILSALKTCSGSIDLSQDRKGQALMLKVYYCPKSHNGYLQLYEYVPHQYEPCSQVYEVDKVENLLK